MNWARRLLPEFPKRPKRHPALSTESSGYSSFAKWRRSHLVLVFHHLASTPKPTHIVVFVVIKQCYVVYLVILRNIDCPVRYLLDLVALGKNAEVISTVDNIGLVGLLFSCGFKVRPKTRVRVLQ